MLKVSDIRTEFIRLYNKKEFITDKTGVKTIEIIGAKFEADEKFIFGNPNNDYISREIKWYESQSLNVNDIIPPIPSIWKQVATPSGEINSNYGWAIFSNENFNQYEHVLAELKRNKDSRRAIMIYNRPNMHIDYCRDGMSDFMCCQNTCHFIRNKKLVTLVNFRSNDSISGYKNDIAWAEYVHSMLADDLNIETGQLIWYAYSLHIYERNFYLIDEYIKNNL